MPYDDRIAASPASPALQAYLASIENCFIALRGRGIQWSHDDGARARSWFDVGVPAGAVVRVIESRVRAWEFSHGRSSSVPASLRWYDPAVLDHTRHLRRTGQGLNSATPRRAPDGGAAHGEGMGAPAPVGVDACDPATADEMTLGRLVETAAELARTAALAPTALAPVVAHAYRAGFTALDRGLHGSDAGETAPPDLAAVVDRARVAVVKAALGGLPDAERAEIEAAVAARLEPLRTTISRKALHARGRLLLETCIAARAGLQLPTCAGWQEPDDVA